MTDKKTGKQPWDQQEGESAKWYGRFSRYRMMGKQRSVLVLVNQDRAERGMKPAKVAPGGWTSMVTRWKWGERAEAFDLSQVKSTEQLFQEEADKFREDERKVFRMLFIKLAQRVQLLKPDELSPDGLSHALLSVAKALEKVYGLESKAAQKGGEDEEDEDFTESLASFRRLQSKAIQTAQQHAAKATGTDGQAHAIPAPAAPMTASNPKKQPSNGQDGEIRLFSR